MAEHCVVTTSQSNYYLAHKIIRKRIRWAGIPPMSKEDKSTLDLHIEELIADGETTNFGLRTQERRQKARISEPFPARIWGVDSGHLPFNVDGVIDNISSTGLYLKTPKAVGSGSEVKLIVHLLSGPS